MVAVRPARHQDISELVAIDSLCSPAPWGMEQFARELALSHSFVFIACEESRIVGFVCAWIVADELEIHSIAVEPSHRRKGIGRLLLEYTFTRCRFKKAYLEVRQSNIAARNLYTKLSFSELFIRKNYYPDGENGIIMQKACTE